MSFLGQRPCLPEHPRPSIRSYAQLVLICLMSECYRAVESPDCPVGLGHGCPISHLQILAMLKTRAWRQHSGVVMEGPASQTSVTGISGLGLTSIFCFSLETSPTSSRPSPLPDSQTMRFAQGADPTGHRSLGIRTMLGPQNPFLGTAATSIGKIKIFTVGVEN